MNLVFQGEDSAKDKLIVFDLIVAHSILEVTVLSLHFLPLGEFNLLVGVGEPAVRSTLFHILLKLGLEFAILNWLSLHALFK